MIDSGEGEAVLVTRYSEIRFNAAIFKEILDSVDPVKPFITNGAKSVQYINETSKIETDVIGYMLPVEIRRRDRETKKVMKIDAKVTIPYSAVLSLVEYEWDKGESSQRIGFSTGG